MRFHRGTPVVVLAVLLAGCSSAPAADSPPPAMPDPVTITGSGTVQTPFDVPEGAKSVRIDVACATGIVVVDAGGDVGSAISGQCGGVYHFALSLPDRPVAQIQIRVSSPPEGLPEPFAATVAFSPDPKTTDAALAEDCADLGEVYTDIANAEDGFDNGLDAAGWAEVVAGGVSKLDAMTPTELQAPQVAAMRDWLAAASAPGMLYEEMPLAVQKAQSIAGYLCTDNGSIITVKPGSGG